MALATCVAQAKPPILPREGELVDSSWVHESLAFAGGCNPAEQLSISVQRSVFFDMSAVEAHARIFPEKFGADEASSSGVPLIMRFALTLFSQAIY